MFNLLPFQFKRLNDNWVLLVNECGDFHFIDQASFDSFVRLELDESSDTFLDLKSKLFLYQDDIDLPLEKLSARYRTKKSFLREFTSLHMLVTTLRCNQRCQYCQVSCADQEAKAFDMSEETAHKIVDMIFLAPAKRPKIEFQGGEHLLNWPVIKSTVEYAEKAAPIANKEVSFVICTNLTAITRDQLLFCRDHGISVSTSLDGPREIHDRCRKTRSGEGTHSQFLAKLDLAREVLGQTGVDALMTTTAFSVNRLNEVIDEYVRLGLNGVFIRSLNPYGFAVEEAATLGHDMLTFAKNYIGALEYIFEINRKAYFPELFATLLFTRILTPFGTGFVDLQSPSGAGISGAIYDFDGSVFPSDEARMLARMGDSYFCLGNVFTDSFKDIFGGRKLRGIITKACVETTPGCAWCAYQAHCGTDPVRNYLETGDELRNMVGSPFCAKHETIFGGLFSILRESDPHKLDTVWAWVNGKPSAMGTYAKG